MLLNGTEGQEMLDNMTVTKDGKILLQEDRRQRRSPRQDLAVRPGGRRADGAGAARSGSRFTAPAGGEPLLTIRTRSRPASST